MSTATDYESGTSRRSLELLYRMLLVSFAVHALVFLVPASERMTRLSAEGDGASVNVKLIPRRTERPDPQADDTRSERPSAARPDPSPARQTTPLPRPMEAPAERLADRQPTARTFSQPVKNADPLVGAATSTGVDTRDETIEQDPYAHLAPSAWPGTLPLYPPPLLDMGYDIYVVIEIRLAPDGRLLDARVVKSSGFPSLDDAAIESAGRREFASADKPRTLTQMVTFESSRDD